MTDAYAGIDVAIAKQKPLPVVVCVRRGGVVVPLPLNARDQPKLPRGCGNVMILEAEKRSRFAAKTVEYLREIEKRHDVNIVRIGIDAPSAPRSDNQGRRKAEVALRELGISYIQTPTESDFERMSQRVSNHLAAGGTPATLPYANSLWMLFGFELFRTLSGAGWQCLEVYPQATVRALGAGSRHKSKKGAVLEQLIAASRHTFWPSSPSLAALKAIGYGSPHDRLDAYLAAWVASLEERDRRALGRPPDDAIWIPKTGDEA